MACLLAKLDRPDVDPRKPYTEIGTPDSFSGRSYDEQHLTRFIQSHRLPCNFDHRFLDAGVEEHRPTPFGLIWN